MVDASVSNVDLDANPEVITKASQAPGGTAGGVMPVVGTNAQSTWPTWDPNQWWTDWKLPADPRPSWELWHDWSKQLRAAVPAINDASKDWQTLIGQFQNSLQSVRSMRAELASWTGPSAKTMGESLDRLENSINTKMASIQDNPKKLQSLAQMINDTGGPLDQLDAEYQQVLTNLTQCRQVALRGKPIMLDLANKLLQTGTDLENSVNTDNLAPQPVAPQSVALADGAQGPTQQMAQVAGSAGNTDPGAVHAAPGVAVANLPTSAGASNGLTDPGTVHTATTTNAHHMPGVSVANGDPTAASVPVAQQSGAQTSGMPSLAGGGAGFAAPTMPTMPTGGAAMSAMPTAGGGGAFSGFVPTPPIGGAGSISSMPSSAGSSGFTSSFAPSVAASGATPAAMAPNVASTVTPADQRRDAGVHGTSGALVAMPAPAAGVPGASGSVAVPTGLAGRNRQRNEERGETVVRGVARRADREPQTLRYDEEDVLDAEAFQARQPGSGLLAKPQE